MARSKVLGRGLASLLPDVMEPGPSPAGPTEGTYREISPDLIEVNHAQPRTDFVEDRLAELTESIRQQGILQALVVRESEGGRYELVAGERRLRASRRLGLETVPVLVRQADDRDMLELALIENIQRDELNAIELAQAFQNLKERFDYSHEEISNRVGKDRTTITNHLRLLNLPEEVQASVAGGMVTMGHARAIAGLGTEQEILACHARILKDGLTVRQTEKLVREAKAPRKKKAQQELALPPAIRSVNERLTRSFSTRVQLVPKGKGKGGTIQIDYGSDEELNRLLDQLLS